MPTLKKSNSPTTFCFADGSYVEKLFARDVRLDIVSASTPTLRVDLSHYSKRRRNDPEGTDFVLLEQNISQITHFRLRDATVAKAFQNSTDRHGNVVPGYAPPGTVEICLGQSTSRTMAVVKASFDHREVVLELH